MNVYINKKNTNNERELVEVQLIKESNKTFFVKLSDNHIIKRKKKRDLPNV